MTRTYPDYRKIKIVIFMYWEGRQYSTNNKSICIKKHWVIMIRKHHKDILTIWDFPSSILLTKQVKANKSISQNHYWISTPTENRAPELT